MLLTFVETKLFTELVQNYFTDEEYAALQNGIAANPEAGRPDSRIRWRSEITVGSGRPG